MSISPAARILARVASGDFREANAIKMAPVAAVDPQRAMVRLRMGGSDADPFLSPWVPYAQTAGGLKVHTPPTIGQQFGLLSPGGDWEQGFAVPLTWSDDYPAPSEVGDEHVLTFGNVRLTITDGRLRAEVGGAVLELTADGLAVEGEALKHNGTDVGDTHVHPGIERGGANTDPPLGSDA